MTDMKRGELVLSVREPYASQIVDGEKWVEYRSRKTNIRGRVLIYSTKPTGLIIGSVEICSCKSEVVGWWGWVLKNPLRFKKPITPKNHPQPVFWREPINPPTTTRRT